MNILFTLCGRAGSKGVKGKNHHDYFWCPRHKGTERQFECTRAITGRQAIRAIERLRADFHLVAPKERHA